MHAPRRLPGRLPRRERARAGRSPVLLGLLSAAVIALLVLGLVILVAQRAPTPATRAEEAALPPFEPGGQGLPLREVTRRLRPLHRSLAPARPADWRSGPGRDECGQTYAEWRQVRPVLARGTRRVLYTTRIGAVGSARAEILELTTAFLGLYFGLETKALEPVTVDEAWPLFSRRPGQGFGEQLRTPYILRNLLEPELPADAAVLVGLTAWDLWPGRGWSFVFGEASLHKRVGVWSIRRFGEPGEDRAAWLRCLRRALKLATHETGHIFSIDHCTAYRCNMCGSNSLEETDRHPLHLCPECLPKLCEATDTDPVERFTALERFCTKHGLEAEAAFYARCLSALRED